MSKLSFLKRMAKARKKSQLIPTTVRDWFGYSSEVANSLSPNNNLTTPTLEELFFCLKCDKLTLKCSWQYFRIRLFY